jgi:hypothetical protein
MNGKELKLEVIEVSHTLSGGVGTVVYSTDAGRYGR